jgi:integrase/recombinase XerD
VKGVARPKSETGEGKTPALGDHQARKLLDAPDGNRLKLLRQGRLSDADDGTRNKRDRAILSTLLFHALRREELCKLKVKDFRHTRKGVPHLSVSGKGGKRRYLPLHHGTRALIHEYLDAAGHGEDLNGALFRPIRNHTTGERDKAITPDGIYKLVRAYSAELGFRIGAHALRATAATNALDHQADIAKVTPTSPPRGSMIIAAPSPRTARRSRSLTEAPGSSQAPARYPGVASIASYPLAR